MPMPITKRKEALGQAYVRAIVAKVGYNITTYENDFGLDGTIKDVDMRDGRYHGNGFSIEYQLKSSSAISFEDGYLIYDLESKNYNDLAAWEGGTPAILILYVMPENEEDWVNFSVDGLVIKKCAWWCSLEGNPTTDNERTKRIRIPVSQVFSPDSLIQLMAKVRRGDNL